MRSHRHARYWSALVLAVTLSLAACGGDDDGDTSSSAPPETSQDATGGDTGDSGGDDGDTGGDDGAASDLACSVVGEAEAADLFGEPARAAQDATPAPTGSSCFWENTDGAEIGQVGHLLQVYVYEGEQFYDESVAPNAEPLADLGDKAYVNVIEGVNPQVTVNVLVGDRLLVLSYSTVNVGVPEGEQVDATARRDAVVDLARAAIGRL